MLRIEADGVTHEELADLRARHDIVDRPGFVTLVNVRRVDKQIFVSTQRMKEGYWKTLQAQPKTPAEAESAA